MKIRFGEVEKEVDEDYVDSGIKIEVCTEENECGEYGWKIFRQTEIIADGMEDTFEKAYLMAYVEYQNNCTFG